MIAVVSDQNLLQSANVFDGGRVILPTQKQYRNVCVRGSGLSCLAADEDGGIVQMTGVRFQPLSLAVARRIKNFVRWLALGKVSQSLASEWQRGDEVDKERSGRDYIQACDDEAQSGSLGEGSQRH